MTFVELEDLYLDYMANRMIYRHVPDLFWDNFPNITSLKIRTHHCPLLTVMETISKKYPKMEKFHFYSYNVPDGDRADEKVWGITKQSLDSLENAAKFLNLKELYVEFDPKFYDHFDFDPDFPEDYEYVRAKNDATEMLRRYLSAKCPSLENPIKVLQKHENYIDGFGVVVYKSGAPDSFKGPIALDWLHRDIDINDMF